MPIKYTNNIAVRCTVGLLSLEQFA